MNHSYEIIARAKPKGVHKQPESPLECVIVNRFSSALSAEDLLVNLRPLMPEKTLHTTTADTPLSDKSTDDTQTYMLSGTKELADVRQKIIYVLDELKVSYADSSETYRHYSPQLVGPTTLIKPQTMYVLTEYFLVEFPTNSDPVYTSIALTRDPEGHASEIHDMIIKGTVLGLGAIVLLNILGAIGNEMAIRAFVILGIIVLFTEYFVAPRDAENHDHSASRVIGVIAFPFIVVGVIFAIAFVLILIGLMLHPEGLFTF